MLRGIDFNLDHNNPTLTLLAGKNCKYYGNVLISGLNDSNCAYFCYFENEYPKGLSEENDSYKYIMFNVNIPPDARVYLQNGIVRSDKVVLSDQRDLWVEDNYDVILSGAMGNILDRIPPEHITQEFCYRVAEERKAPLKSIPTYFRSYLICQHMVEFSGSNIKDVPTDFIDLLADIAIDQDIRHLRDIPEKCISYSLCKRAVKKNFYAMAYLPKRFKCDKTLRDIVRNTKVDVEVGGPHEHAQKIRKDNYDWIINVCMQ